MKAEAHPATASKIPAVARALALHPLEVIITAVLAIDDSLKRTDSENNTAEPRCAVISAELKEGQTRDSLGRAVPQNLALLLRRKDQPSTVAFTDNRQVLRQEDDHRKGFPSSSGSTSELQHLHRPVGRFSHDATTTADRTESELL